MTLKEKLHHIYEAIALIEKRGENVQQRYSYIKAADVTNAIRAQLIAQKVYAEINFNFIGGPYTIARSKDLNAPFSAVNVRCEIVFHDLESAEKLTSSGVGSAADTGDKAAYKAQTGALKYALKNAFLIPDEADPEADETIDGGAGDSAYRQADPPDFHEARHAAPRPAATQTTKQDPKPSVTAQEAPLPPPPPPTPAEKQNNGPAVPPDGPLPTEAELTDYRKKFNELGDDLSAKGGLKSSKGLPINRKLLVFLLKITGAAEAKSITTAQWDDFFQRADHVKSLENGLVGLTSLVNKANGIEEKK